MKLKTLNDIGGTTHVMKSWIKAEAVKWVQFYMEIKYNEPEYPQARINLNWIKHFFNITEEDLSQGDDSGEPK